MLERSREGAGALDYQSGSLSALLHIFELWRSPAFILKMTSDIVPHLDTTSIIALTHLGRGGPLRPSHLAELLHVGASNVSKILRRLQSSGLIERAIDPQDRRAGLVRLTRFGDEVVTAFVEAGDAMMTEVQRDWDDHDRATLTALLVRFDADITAFARSDPSIHA